MPEWRKLHVKITESLDVNEMPDDFTRLLWVMLPLVVCREGRGVDNPSWVRSRAMPLRDDVTIEQIEAAMRWYAQRGMIQRYTVNHRPYFQIISFSRYQSTQREGETDYPGPDDADCDGDENSEQLRSNSGVSQELVVSNSGVTQELVRSNSGASQELLKSSSGASQELVTSYSVLDVDVDIDIDKEREEDSARNFREDNSGTDKGTPQHDTRRTAPRTPRKPKQTGNSGQPGGAEPVTGIPPGVAEFRAQAHRYPAKSWYGDIARIVGTDAAQVRRWGQIVHYWVGQGWNPSNVAGMLEFFKRGDTPGKLTPAGGQRHSVPLDQVEDVVDAAFNLIGGGDV